jgi:hypothetical protein
MSSLSQRSAMAVASLPTEVPSVRSSGAIDVAQVTMVRRS